MILQIPELDLGYAADLVHSVFLALPSYSLGMAFNHLYTNVRAVEYCSKDIVQMACKTGFMPNPCCKGKFLFNYFVTNFRCQVCPILFLFSFLPMLYNL